MCKFNKLWNRRQWKYLPFSLLCLWPSQEHKLILTQYLGICFLLRPTFFKWKWSPVAHKEAYIRSTVWVNVWIPGCDYCQTILRAGLNMLFNVWPHTIILPSSLERSKWKKNLKRMRHQVFSAGEAHFMLVDSRLALCLWLEPLSLRYDSDNERQTIATWYALCLQLHRIPVLQQAQSVIFVGLQVMENVNAEVMQSLWSNHITGPLCPRWDWAFFSSPIWSGSIRPFKIS